MSSNLFSEAVWRHRYHQGVHNKKEDPKYCPICASDGVVHVSINKSK